MNKTKQIFLALALLLSFVSFSQVGIGTKTPSAYLDILSNGNTSATKALEVNNSSSTEMFTILNNGNVGIGTAAPGTTLQVQSPTAATNTVNSLPVARFNRPHAPGVKWANTMDINIGSYSAPTSHSTTRVDFRLNNGGTDNPDTTVLTMLGNGNVGIGTTAPTASLSVNGVINTSQGIELTQIGSGDRYSYIDFHASDAMDYSLRLMRSPGVNGDFYLENIGTGNFSISTQGSTKFLVNGASGNVGIGTNPTEKLHVNGGVRLQSIPNNTATTAINSIVADENGVLYKINSTPQILVDGSVIIWNISSGFNASITLAGNRSLSITNTPVGTYGVIKITQDAIGNRTLTLPSNSKIQSGDGVSNIPSLSKTAFAIDVLAFYFDGTTYFWTLGQSFN